MNIIEKKNVTLDDDIVKKLNENKWLIDFLINNRYYLQSIIYGKKQMSCHPTTKNELQDIIIKRIKKFGPECDLNDIDVSHIHDMSYLFDANTYAGGHKIFEDFNGDISQWNMSNVKDIDFMFRYCRRFNGDIRQWDVSNVISMRGVFMSCEKFNCDISGWNTENVVYMTAMFYGCKSFNYDLSRWDVSNVRDMNCIFWGGCEIQIKPNWYIPYNK